MLSPFCWRVIFGLQQVYPSVSSAEMKICPWQIEWRFDGQLNKYLFICHWDGIHIWSKGSTSTGSKSRPEIVLTGPLSFTVSHVFMTLFWRRRGPGNCSRSEFLIGPWSRVRFIQSHAQTTKVANREWATTPREFRRSVQILWRGFEWRERKITIPVEHDSVRLPAKELRRVRNSLLKQNLLNQLLSGLTATKMKTWVIYRLISRSLQISADQQSKPPSSPQCWLNIHAINLLGRLSKIHFISNLQWGVSVWAYFP